MNPEKCIGTHHPRWFGLALQALVILSKNEVQKCPSVELAAQLQSEPTQLRRILATLAKGDILETQEGRDGGYRLKRSADTITLADVYKVLQVSDPLSSGIKETAGTHPFGIEMKSIFCELTSEMDRSLVETLSKYTIGQLSHRAFSCESQRVDELKV
ncbi:MAG: Rrf2 family transcriptional regulator [Candidatus Cohnella colombiensis]|uniref:Rrf2 family transcriptional regulator n=1 Tax=Candidatus Cohnella colombiensis TaxID=3121368 RepID=A0AA95F523_9BACL|nr:MAG: Rrf2 family transcriptional regulator [Cohnella sp.]